MAVEDISADKITAWADFLNKLTLKRVFLVIIFVISMIMSYGLWEQRTTTINAVGNNPLVMAMIGGGVMLLGIGAGFISLQGRIDDRNDAMYKVLRDQISDQNAKIIMIEQREQEVNQRFVQIAMLLARNGTDISKIIPVEK